MADGSTRAIDKLNIGDEVLATDPVNSVTEGRQVTRTIHSAGEKNLVEVTIDADGPAGSAETTVTATDNHPFWVPELNEWVQAAALLPGQWLRTSAGTAVQIAKVSRHTEVTQVHNLTVDGLHTYYVAPADVSVLVHNTSACKVTKTEHMNDVEIAQSHEIGDHLGGKEFVGQPQKDTPGIDGFLDGVPTS